MFFDLFSWKLTKKNSVESAKYDFKKLFYTCTVSFWAFFHGSGFSGSDPEFLADLDSGKKVRSGSGQKDPDPKHCFKLLASSPERKFLQKNLLKDINGSIRVYRYGTK